MINVKDLKIAKLVGGENMFSFNVDTQINIELLQQKDKLDLFNLIDNNRNHLREWLVWVDKRKSPQDFETIIPAWISNYANNNGFDAGIRFNGELVGMIALHYIDWKNKETSIGYFISEKAQGNGIVTKCIKAIMKYLFEDLNINRIEIQVAANNLKSLAIPKRLGFTQESIKHDGQWLYDHYEDLIIFRMLKREWEQ